jgi:glycosyltransferase involved in cell wall biosynthesis
MLLSIAMIVKNEEKDLRKCLEALAPLRQAVDSELIITDTGSTDSTVEIAKEFADKVLHFEWCGDFAKARNTGIRAAKGQWFMFLDADEIFKNTYGIIRFFNSGEYKKYKSAAYVSGTTPQQTGIFIPIPTLQGFAG